METLHFDYENGSPIAAPAKPALAGVLGSGNLEVLVEAIDLNGRFRVEITTAAVGFGRIWKAVMDDVFDRWRLADIRVSINDAGATPAVVALRVDQALEEFTGRTP
jgi:malonate decarboxylase delta subunit